MTRTERFAIGGFVLLGLLGAAMSMEAQAPLAPSPTVAYPIIVKAPAGVGGAQLVITNYSGTTRGLQLINGLGAVPDTYGRPATVVFKWRAAVDTIGYIVALNRCGTPSATISVKAVSTDSAGGYEPMPTTTVKVSYGAMVLIK